MLNTLVAKLVAGVVAVSMLGGAGTMAVTQEATVMDTIAGPIFERVRDGRAGAFGRALESEIVEATGLTRCEVLEARAGGQSFASMLEGAGIEPQTVVDTAIERLDERLTAAVADGRIGQARADEILANAPDRFTQFLENEETDRAEQIYARVCLGEGSGLSLGPRARAGLALTGDVVEQTGLTRCEIAEQRAAGESFTVILGDAGVDVDAFSADVLAQLDDRLDEAVADGLIDAGRAEQIRTNAPGWVETFLTNTDTQRAEQIVERFCTPGE
ncbi:MAG: hypothetical protein GYB64_05790 [Chloroflexi bacterium]|nr:hypothetical protein [Chloroflexota bacterium]